MTLDSDFLGPEFLDIDIALAQVGDAQTLHGMLSMFEESLARDIPRVSQLLAADDLAGTGRLLHSLKGVIHIFCALPFCHRIDQVVEVSKMGTVADVSDAYEAFKPDLEQLQAEVSAYLNE